MSAAVTYPHIVKKDGQPARFIRQPRIRVSLIFTFYRIHGMSAEEISQQLPLSLSEVHSALAYCHDNKEEIDQEYAEDDAILDRLEKNAPATPTREELLERLRKKQAREGSNSGDAS
jgi:uncharacterized protein (DUF433 family)